MQMNNRYLFRGKRKDNKKWVYGNYAFTDINGKQHFIFQNKAFDCEVIPETVGQCTGLKDKNGKLIFEGDILRFVNDDGETSNYEVYWSNDEAGWCIKKEDAFDAMDCWNETRESFEVIGNIYDNPELLEVER